MSRLRFALLIPLAVSLAGCEWLTGSDDEPFDGVVEPVADTARAVTRRIGPEGGSIAVTTEQGISVSLAVPAGALLAPEDITLTPLRRVGDLPLRRGVAVSMTPSGLHFLLPATLTIGAAAGGEAQRLTGFGFGNDGREFHLMPRSGGNQAVLSIWHFSAAGSGEITPSDAENLPVPSDPGAAAQHELARQQLDGQESGSYDADEIALAYAQWFEAAVRPALQNAIGDLPVTQALSDYVAWKREIQEGLNWPPAVANQVAASLEAKLEEADRLAAQAIRGAVDEHNAICLQQSSLDEARVVLEWQQIAERYGLARPEFGLDGASLLLELCVQVRIESIDVPERMTIGESAAASVQAGYVFGSGTVAHHAPPLAATVTLDGSANPGAQAGTTSASGVVTATLVAPDRQGSIGLHARLCMTADGLSSVCATGEATIPVTEPPAPPPTLPYAGVYVGELDWICFNCSQPNQPITVAIADTTETSSVTVTFASGASQTFSVRRIPFGDAVVLSSEPFDPPPPPTGTSNRGTEKQHWRFPIPRCTENECTLFGGLNYLVSIVRFRGELAKQETWVWRITGRMDRTP